MIKKRSAILESGRGVILDQAFESKTSRFLDNVFYVYDRYRCIATITHGDIANCHESVSLQEKAELLRLADNIYYNQTPDRHLAQQPSYSSDDEITVVLKNPNKKLT